MRIALISTCALPTPPAAYGGTERVVAELARGLVELGHEVVVYATGDSHPAGKLRYRYPRAMWPKTEAAERQHAEFALSDLRAGDRIDVVHLNDAAGLDFVGRVDAASALTLHHNREEHVIARCRAHPEVATIAISHRQAALLPELNIARVIHHGLDPERYAFGRGDGGYVAFVGRFTRDKAPHLAIDAALSAGMPIRLAGGPQAHELEYFEREVRPRIERHRTQVHWAGELEDRPKIEMLRGARAMLFPIDWEEPFGLVLIEAMLVGTPVIAFGRGSVPELIEEGTTGFVVSTVAEMTARLRALEGFDRERCMAHAGERWSHRRMAREHADLYQELVASRRRPKSAVVKADDVNIRASVPSVPHG